MKNKYRIRWAYVSRGNGYSLSNQLMCIAERKTWLGFYFPLRNADWRWTKNEALRDIELNKAMREPSKIIEVN